MGNFEGFLVGILVGYFEVFFVGNFEGFLVGLGVGNADGFIVLGGLGFGSGFSLLRLRLPKYVKSSIITFCLMEFDLKSKGDICEMASPFRFNSTGFGKMQTAKIQMHKMQLITRRNLKRNDVILGATI